MELRGELTVTADEAVGTVEVRSELMSGSFSKDGFMFTFILKGIIILTKHQMTGLSIVENNGYYLLVPVVNVHVFIGFVKYLLLRI